MFCSVCGTEVSLAAEVCPACGRPIAATTARSLTRAGAASVDGSNSSSPSNSSGGWPRSVRDVGGPLLAHAETAAAPPHEAAPTASIYAGDLDVPSLPRDLPGRVALLTGLVLVADLLLPWVTINGDGYAPTRFGWPALALLAALVVVIAPPLIPRVRRAPITPTLPFGIGALLLGVGAAIWTLSGPLAPALTTALLGHIAILGGGPVEVNTPTGASLASSPIQMTPAVGLYVFLLGACALTIAGYQMLEARRQR